VTFEEILPFLVPLIALQVILLVAGLYDLSRPERTVKGGNKLVWAAVIVFGQLLGPLVYFLLGREDS
jgi:hypothetical protein